MNKSGLCEIIAKVGEETLADLAFIVTFDCSAEDDAQAAPKAYAAAAVFFQGPLTGAVNIFVSPDLLPALAANMLGLQDGTVPQSDQQYDALQELANVVCGNLLPAISVHNAPYRLSPPRLLSAADAVPAAVEADAAVNFVTDEGDVRLELHLLGQAAG